MNHKKVLLRSLWLTTCDCNNLRSELTLTLLAANATYSLAFGFIVANNDALYDTG